MNLDQTQRQKIQEWLEQGLKLGDIQKKLAAEFSVNITYMELRFLLDDLKLKPKEQAPPPSPPTGLGAKPPASGPTPQAAAQPPAGLPADTLDEPVGEVEEDVNLPAGTANVSLSVDHLAKPGALVSGSVNFSDGNSAQWYLDQTGRLGLAPKQQGYRPSQADLLTFQSLLKSELAKLGY